MLGKTITDNNNKIMNTTDPISSAHQQIDTEQQALLTELMQKEAKLQRVNKARKQLEKESRHMTQSNTWKMTAPIRKLGGFFSMLFHNSRKRVAVEENQQLVEKNRKLETELQTVHNELKMKQTQLNLLKMEATEQDPNHLHKQAKKAKEDGNITQYIHNLVEKKATVDDNYTDSYKKIGRLYNREKADIKQLIYEKVLAGLKIEEIPEFIVRFAESEKSLSLKTASSFRASLTTRARLRQLRGTTPEQILDNKIDAYQLMDNLDMKRPWVKEKRYSYLDIPWEEGIVIKPVEGAGSRGVYLVYDLNRIQDVKQSSIITDWETLETRMQEDLTSGWVTKDEWMIEELIVNHHDKTLPARDIKFYCFYGKVALILEITRYPKVSYCWWTPDGERIRTGKYDEELFTGEGVTIEEVEEAAFISTQLPTPFIRIDFLKTDQGMYFGEFTPKPGNYDEFDKKTDQWLGEFYIDAEGRLAEDLMGGKSFSHYKKWLSQLAEDRQKRTNHVGGRPNGTEQSRMAPTPFE